MACFCHGMAPRSEFTLMKGGAAGISERIFSQSRVMRYFAISLLLFYTLPGLSDQIVDCKAWPNLLKHSCERAKQIINYGQPELYLTGYSWHNRLTYSQTHLNRFNEAAWGGGFGKGLYDENGDWHGFASFVFLDSHKYPEPILGYAFIKMLHLNEDTRLGAGYSFLVTERPDVWRGRPFPGILPWVYLSYSHVTICSTYIPGRIGIGNVLFTYIKWTF